MNLIRNYFWKTTKHFHVNNYKMEYSLLFFVKEQNSWEFSLLIIKCCFWNSSMKIMEKCKEIEKKLLSVSNVAKKQ